MAYILQSKAQVGHNMRYYKRSPPACRAPFVLPPVRPNAAGRVRSAHEPASNGNSQGNTAWTYIQQAARHMFCLHTELRAEKGAPLECLDDGLIRRPRLLVALALQQRLAMQQTLPLDFPSARNGWGNTWPNQEESIVEADEWA